MDDTSVGYYLTAVLAVALLLYKAPSLWTARNPIRGPVLALLVLIAVTEFSAAPVTIGILNRVTGIPNFSAALVYCLVVALACSAGILIAYWRDPVEQARRAARWWVSAYAAVIVVLIALFAIGDAPVERRVDFDTFYARNPAIAAHITLYLLAYGWGAVVISGMTWRWSKVAGRPWLRRGLRVMAFGSVFGIAFTIAKLTAVFARMLAVGDLDFLSSQAAPAFAGLATLLFAIGFAMPAAGERITRLHSRIRRTRDYRDLYPLTAALQDGIPALQTKVKLPRDLELRASYRLTVIRDGQLALRGFYDPTITFKAKQLAEAEGMEGITRDAVIEAARLAAALKAKAEGRRFSDSSDNPDDRRGTDGASELEWLAEVSRVFALSPLVKLAAEAHSQADIPAPPRNSAHGNNKRPPKGIPGIGH